MTTSHGRKLQGRRALAILSWISLVAVAAMLWRGQYQGIIRSQAWEPAALMLSAYVTFLAIFGWLLFSPQSASTEESPGLFFAGMLTLVPPCFIAYHLMPVGSPLKPWVTIAVFLFGILAIMSPLPPEVFGVPRDRRSYLRPLTDSRLMELDIEPPSNRMDDILPRTAFFLTGVPTLPDGVQTESGIARDPWSDPFYGTGRQLSRVGVRSTAGAGETAARPVRRTEERKGEGRQHAADDSLTNARAEETSKRTYSDSVSSTHVPLPRRPLREPDVSSPESTATDLTESSSGILSRSIPPTLRTGLSSHSLGDPPVYGPVGPSARSAPVSSASASIPPVIPPAMNPVSAPAVESAFVPLTYQRVSAPEASPQSGSGSVRLERVRDEHGGEMIEGTISVFFETGQRRAHLHVPFSPPLAGIPEVECEPSGDDDIRLKVAVCQPYGVRIEARRTDTSAELRTEISFAAVYTP